MSAKVLAQGSGPRDPDFWMPSQASVSKALAARYGLSAKPGQKRAAPASQAEPKQRKRAKVASGMEPVDSAVPGGPTGVGSAKESDAQHLLRHANCAKRCARCKLLASRMLVGSSISFYTKAKLL